MTRSGAAALFVVLTSAAVFALADDKPTARLSWVRLPGAESCPDEASLRKSVSARLGRDPFVASPSLAIEGTIARETKRWIAKLWVRDDKGAPLGDRELTSEADTCASLGEAVSLAIALSIDPDAAAAAPSAGPTASASVEKPKPVFVSVQKTVPVPVPLPSPAPQSAVFARGLLSTSLLPRPTWGVALSFEPVLAHHLRAVFGAQHFGSQRTSDGVAAISLTTMNAGACGGATGTLRFGVDACASLHVGATHSVAFRHVPEQPGDRLWLGVSAGLRLRAHLLSGLYLDILTAELLVPLTRHRFYVAPASAETPIFSQGPWGLVAGAGLGWNLF